MHTITISHITEYRHMSSRLTARRLLVWVLAKAFLCVHIKPETHCTICSCPRQKTGIVKQSWWFLWSWFLIRGPVSYSERDSKMTVVTALRPKIAYNTAWLCVFAATIHVYWTTNKSATWNQHNMVLKHFLFHLFHFFVSTHKYFNCLSVIYHALFVTTNTCWCHFIIP